jgi:putative FmdB family regulatory protein
MPIYEYECPNGHIQEELVSHSDIDNIKTCPVCGKKAKRIMSQNNFQLKGTGWYVTDYAKKSVNK